jgi:hypothetical protein
VSGENGDRLLQVGQGQFFSQPGCDQRFKFSGRDEVIATDKETVDFYPGATLSKNNTTATFFL